jgi:probable phosphoglycerate mutase
VREGGVAPEPSYERAWRERDLGVYQGLTDDHLFERHPAFDPDNGFVGIHSRPEDGESLLDLHRRIEPTWTRLRRDLDAETVLVVTQGGPLHVIHGLVAGDDVLSTFRTYAHGNCGYSTFEVEGEDVTVAAANETGWAEA